MSTGERRGPGVVVSGLLVCSTFIWQTRVLFARTVSRPLSVPTYSLLTSAIYRTVDTQYGRQRHLRPRENMGFSFFFFFYFFFLRILHNTWTRIGRIITLGSRYETMDVASILDSRLLQTWSCTVVTTCYPVPCTRKCRAKKQNTPL